jgi:hypothetical protein
VSKGDLQKGGRQRKQPQADRIAERVKNFADGHVAVPHVTPLNSGFFHLERLRSATVTKKRNVKKRKVKSK